LRVDRLDYADDIVGMSAVYASPKPAAPPASEGARSAIAPDPQTAT
jgi:hypothetical protein